MYRNMDETNAAAEHRELTLDELDRVTGGMDNNMATVIDNTLCAIPVVGAFAATARVITNAISIWRGNPTI